MIQKNQTYKIQRPGATDYCTSEVRKPETFVCLTLMPEDYKTRLMASYLHTIAQF